MKRVLGVKDLGIILSPDKKNEPFYEIDGGGMRDVVINREVVGKNKGVYYLSYDGAMPGKTDKSYWQTCTAKSKDLISWEKIGVKLLASGNKYPNGSTKVYKDFCGTLSPWEIYEDGKWYRFYLGSDFVSPEGIPAVNYYTMLATADTLEGPFHKVIDQKGKEKHVCFPLGKTGAWDDVTSSPGHVLINPKWEKDKINQKKYIMIYSGSCSGDRMWRSMGLARTNDLSLTDDFDKQDGNFWVKDKDPIIPLEHDVENASIYFDENTQTYYLFTNHIYNNEYTDAVWVYWTKDLDKWNPDDKAVVLDASVSTWAKGAIGLPSVIKKDDNTLCLFYDGVDGNGKGHLDRKVGMCEISLPIKIK